MYSHWSECHNENDIFLRKPCLFICRTLRNLKDIQNPYEILLVQLRNDGFGLSMIAPIRQMPQCTKF